MQIPNALEIQEAEKDAQRARMAAGQLADDKARAAEFLRESARHLDRALKLTDDAADILDSADLSECETADEARLRG